MSTDSKTLVQGDFWGEYAARVRERGVAEEEIPAYVNWARAFAKSQAGPLRDRKPADVRQFLEARTGRATAIVKAQAREALVILYRDLLNLDLRARQADAAAEARFVDSVTVIRPVQY